MAKKQALEEADLPPVGEEPELDQAISDLRGVLEEDAAGAGDSLMDSLGDDATNELPEIPAGGFTMDDFPDTIAQPDMEPQETDAIDMNDFGSNSVEMPSSTGASGTMANPDIIMDIPVEVQIVLGKTRMKVSSLMKLDEGATISLDRRIGESVDIMVNGRMIGHGEITVLEEDETRFGVKLTEILGAKKPSGEA